MDRRPEEEGPPVAAPRITVVVRVLPADDLDGGTAGARRALRLAFVDDCTDGYRGRNPDDLGDPLHESRPGRSEPLTR